ncbi:hypothetical protein BX600DRAFT_477424 [Xylariales sp. PMI_506]|nr:hypothetical protein BX600DRAFT_477424 [Xylariales sp. PMI_506]
MISVTHYLSSKRICTQCFSKHISPMPLRALMLMLVMIWGVFIIIVLVKHDFFVVLPILALSGLIASFKELKCSNGDCTSNNCLDIMSLSFVVVTFSLLADTVHGLICHNHNTTGIDNSFDFQCSSHCFEGFDELIYAESGFKTL